MHKQTFFRLLFPLLFPLALSAQQAQSDPQSAHAVFMFADESAFQLEAPPADATDERVLPDAPGARNEEALAGAAYAAKSSKAPAPAVESVRVFSKTFIAVHSVFWGSIVYDAELTHQGLAHHKCVESNPALGTHPSRGKIYGENLLTFSAISGLDWVAAKMKIRYLPYVGPAVGTAIHITGGSKWLTECW
jgi:hypothetical protein